MGMKTSGIIMKEIISEILMRPLIEVITYLELSIMKVNVTSVTILDTAKNCRSGLIVYSRETKHVPK